MRDETESLADPADSVPAVVCVSWHISHMLLFMKMY